MATAQLIKPKPVKQPQAKVILELSEGEADFILGVTALIAGNLYTSPRKYAERIKQALTEALGYEWSETDSVRLASTNTSYRGIFFSDYGTDGYLGRHRLQVLAGSTKLNS